MPVGWEHIGGAAAAAGVLVLLLILFLWRFCCHNQKAARGTERVELEGGIAKLRHRQVDSQRGGNYYVFRRGAPTMPMFNWADYPSLVTDAVENGWSRFGFTGGYMTSSSPFSEVEIGWEISQGSADFMQRMRLNSGLKKSTTIGAESVVRTALPLPGPHLSFPQEAYFEITVLGRGDSDRSRAKITESEKARLIQHNSNPKTNSESLVDDLSSHGAVAVSVGLAGGGSLPLKLPGTYPSSIGFNSNGSVYLDGIKLVFESEKAEWGRKDQVIGCGFDPRNKKVFFTLDSEVVHVFHCQPDEFGAPLYPTLAANCDIAVLVNFGQSSFSYTPANAHRTSNPCFIAPIASSPAALGYDDSKELFSMGRIDSQWLNRSATRSNYTDMGEGFDAEYEGELFEITLDGKSTNTK